MEREKEEKKSKEFSANDAKYNSPGGTKWAFEVFHSLVKYLSVPEKEKKDQRSKTSEHSCLHIFLAASSWDFICTKQWRVFLSRPLSQYQWNEWNKDLSCVNNHSPFNVFSMSMIVLVHWTTNWCESRLHVMLSHRTIKCTLTKVHMNRGINEMLHSREKRKQRDNERQKTHE